MQEVLDEALSLAVAGIPVFPCRSADEMAGGTLRKCKSPYIRKGFKAATLDNHQIRSWWSKWPNALIGVPTGRVSGFIVLDLDVDPNTGKNGIEFMKRFPELPKTRTVGTPCGGLHYYYQYRKGIQTSAGKIGSGVDVRSDGGYVIVPPSRLNDGRRYSLVVKDDLAALPDFLAEAMAKPQVRSYQQKNGGPTISPIRALDGAVPPDAKYAAAALLNECEKISTAPSGTRNEVLNIGAFSLAQFFTHGILGEEVVRQELVGAATRSGLVEDDGLGAVLATINSGFEAGRKKPRDLHGINNGPDRRTQLLPTKDDPKKSVAQDWPEPVDLFAKLALPDMNLNLLPKTIRDFVKQESELTGADPAGYATAALTIIASVIPDCQKVQVKEHDTAWRERACLWSMLAGGPSSMKTPIINAAAGPVKAIQDRRFHDFQVKSEIAEMNGESKPAPSRRIYVNDTTGEALQRRMAENPNGLLALQDELSGWISNLDRYAAKDSARGDRAFCLSAFNGGPYTIDRVKAGTIHIENASMSVLGGIQPDIIAEMSAKMGDDGLLQRFLICNLVAPGPGMDKPRNQEIDHNYTQLIDSLANDSSEGRTHVFDKKARKIINNFRAYSHSLKALEEHSSKLAGWCGKLDAQVARLALTLHYAEANRTEVPLSISAGTAQNAVDLVKTYYFSHAIHFFTETLGENATDEKARWIAGYILAHGLERITFRDLDRGGAAVKNSSDRERRKYLRFLESFGWVQPEVKLEATCKAWIVNPAVHELFQKRAQSESKIRKETREIIRKNAAKPSGKTDD